MTGGASLQETYGPAGICFGCGPSNPRGLHLLSYPEGEDVVAEWSPEPHHTAFPDVLNGGIIATLLDCHANWTAWWALFRADGKAEPMTVTASISLRLLKPTPMADPVRLSARTTEIGADRAEVAAEMTSSGRLTATMTGLFVRPRWPAAVGRTQHG